jgi:hypothetical protein
MPSRSGVCHPVGSMSGCGPDNYWVQIPSVAAHAFDRCYRCALDRRASIASLLVFFADEDLDRSELRKHNASLIHIVHVLLKNVWVIKYLPNNYVKATMLQNG